MRQTLSPCRLLGLLALLTAVGCIDDRASADPPEHDASADDFGRPDAEGAAPIDAHLTEPPLDAGSLDAEPLDAGPPDAEPPDAGETECALPLPPLVDCSPEQFGAFEPVAADVLQPIALIGDVDPARVGDPDQCSLEPAAWYDLADEAAFQALLTCPAGVARSLSTIDWARHRLILVAAMPTTELIWTVIRDGALRLGFETPPDCAGAPMPRGMRAFLVPADAPPLGEPFDCVQPLGPQGCCSCEVICDPAPRVGECLCPP